MKAKGYVKKRGDTWYFVIYDEDTDKVLAKDNTGSWKPMFEECYQFVAALRILNGHRGFYVRQSKEYRTWLRNAEAWSR